MKIVFLLFSFFAIAHGWTDHFTQASVFTGWACQKHKSRTWTETEGINYRLSSNGTLVYKGEEDIAFNIPKNVPLQTCAKQCAENPRCNHFAHRAADGLCQFVTHCKYVPMDNSFRYFDKFQIGCHSTIQNIARRCVGEPTMTYGTQYTRVDECMEFATLNGIKHFTMDGNMTCNLYVNCEETKYDQTSTTYKI